jgi:GIY-YIG catalytic domain
VTAPLLEYLRAHPEGVLPVDAAREVLRLAGPDDIIAKVARLSLLAIPGCREDPGGRLHLDPPEQSPTLLALVALTTGPHPAFDQLLAVGVSRIEGDRVRDTFGTVIRPDRPIGPQGALDAGVDPRALERGMPTEEALDRFAPWCSNSLVLTFSGRMEFEFLVSLLRQRGREEPPSGHLALAPALRRGGAMPPRGDLLAAARTLRVPEPETQAPGDHAAALARVYLAAVMRGIDFSPPRKRPQFDFGRTNFGAELLTELPERPGVYRFLDRRGHVLYVGKSKDLRARISSYFGFRERRRRRHADLMQAVADLKWEETGSELTALFRELELIREHAPPYNVQREVRRRRPKGGDLVLFLPGPEKGDVDLLLVRNGSPAGRVRSDIRGGNMREVRRALAGTYFAAGPPQPGNEDDAQILESWLRAGGRDCNFVDLSEVSGRNDAARRIRDYLTDPELFRARMFRR